jgi:hypothetical protein
MARISIALSAAKTTIGKEGFALNPVADVVNSVSTATVTADIATLVADGASPTQAHVTTLNTDYTALLAGIAAIPAVKDLVVSFDNTKITSYSSMDKAFNAILKALKGANYLTYNS